MLRDVFISSINFHPHLTTFVRKFRANFIVKHAFLNKREPWIRLKEAQEFMPRAAVVGVESHLQRRLTKK